MGVKYLKCSGSGISYLMKCQVKCQILSTLECSDQLQSMQLRTYQVKCHIKYHIF